MRVWPQTGAAWGRLLLLPFKVYVLTGWLGARFDIWAAGRQYDPDLVGLVILGYLGCFLVLVAGATVQRVCGRKEESAASFLAAALAVVFLWLLFPALAKT